MLTRPDDMRRLNRAKVLAALRKNGALSRTDIAECTGLSAATVTTITADLLEYGVLLREEESSEGASQRGRPRVSLCFNPDFACIGVIVLQLNLIMISIVDYQGTTIFKSEKAVKTTTISADKLLVDLSESFQNGLEQSGCDIGALKHIAVGVQGTTDVEGTMLLWSPIIQHQKLLIQKHLQPIHNVSVSVHNDCNMIAVALRWKEPDRFKEDFATILLSQGIGMGLYHNGELVTGKRSSATEFGHMTYIPDGAPCRCGRKGCIEAYASEYAIYRKVNSTSKISPINTDTSIVDLGEVLDRAQHNDADAKMAYEQAGEAIGAGLASLFALIDPRPVAFVGSGSKARNLLETPIRRAIGKSNMSVDNDPVAIHFYDDEHILIQDGCAVTALSEVDNRLRSNGVLDNPEELQGAA